MVLPWRFERRPTSSPGPSRFPIWRRQEGPRDGHVGRRLVLSLLHRPHAFLIGLRFQSVIPIPPPSPPPLSPPPHVLCKIIEIYRGCRGQVQGTFSHNPHVPLLVCESEPWILTLLLFNTYYRRWFCRDLHMGWSSRALFEQRWRPCCP